MWGLVQSSTIGELCRNWSGLLALTSDPRYLGWVSREHSIPISDRQLLLVSTSNIKRPSTARIPWHLYSSILYLVFLLEHAWHVHIPRVRRQRLGARRPVNCSHNLWDPKLCLVVLNTMLLLRAHGTSSTSLTVRRFTILLTVWWIIARTLYQNPLALFSPGIPPMWWLQWKRSMNQTRTMQYEVEATVLCRGGTRMLALIDWFTKLISLA